MAKKETESFTDLDAKMVQRSESELAQLSFDDLVSGTTIEVSDIDERQVFEKESLVGKKMFILQWAYRSGDYGSDYAVVFVVTEDGKGIFTDGGTGIKEQLFQYEQIMTERNLWDDFAKGGIYLPKGLRVSHYTYTDDSGKEQPAKTYYLDNSKA